MGFVVDVKVIFKIESRLADARYFQIRQRVHYSPHGATQHPVRGLI